MPSCEWVNSIDVKLITIENADDCIRAVEASSLQSSDRCNLIDCIDNIAFDLVMSRARGIMGR